jgi:mannosylglycerate hydrolase
LRAVAAGGTALLPAERAQLRIEPAEILLSALKPAEQGEGVVVRLLNPTDTGVEARLTVGFPFRAAESLCLDERPADFPLTVRDQVITLPLPPHAVRTLRLCG